MLGCQPLACTGSLRTPQRPFGPILRTLWRTDTLTLRLLYIDYFTIVTIYLLIMNISAKLLYFQIYTANGVAWLFIILLLKKNRLAGILMLHHILNRILLICSYNWVSYHFYEEYPPSLHFLWPFNIDIEYRKTHIEDCLIISPQCNVTQVRHPAQ